MLGVRFLDVDFMRENLACARPQLYMLYVFIAQSSRATLHDRLRDHACLRALKPDNIRMVIFFAEAP